MLKNKKGFSLLEMMIVGGMIAGIGMVVMQLSKNTFSNQSEAFNSADYFGLKAELDSMFSNPFDCTASLTNVTFNGNTIRTVPRNVEIWKGDQFAVRTRKVISGTDANSNKYGKLVIGAVQFSMPDYTLGLNFPAGIGQSFKGEIKIEGSKTKLGKTSPFVAFTKSINVGFNTNSLGVSTITGCNGFGKGAIQILASSTGYDGQTGTTACASVGGTCAYVQSHNFIRDDTGCPGVSQCMRICTTWYNQSLPGIANEVVNGKDNIHPCNAQIGTFTTYLDPGVVRCNAFFHAVCNK